MRKRILFVLAGLMLFLLAACGGKQGAVDSVPPSAAPSSETSAPAETEPAATPTGDTVPEETANTQKDDTMEEIKVKITVGDTELTAVLEDNSTTRALVEQMPMTLPMLDLYGREMCYRYGGGALPTDSLRSDGYEVGGTLHSIITQEPYSSDYDKCLDRAIEEHDSGTRPALSSSVSNMADYDVIFLGYPIWWYTSPMVVRTFLEAYNFSGKTIVPFCTSVGVEGDQSVNEIRGLCPNANVLDGLTLHTGRADEMPESISTWLDQLGLS